ncbi:MAG: DNA mismatch endonuclease Vsr [Chitinophagia bacterium]|nr:DNA mismatch endonuclease Vsr [Chitinophagia bacterium]
MADVHDSRTRSYNMSRIQGKNTKPELLVRKFLHSMGFRFRLHRTDLQGKPDIILPKYKTAIFIHGCFWHGHEGCKYFRLPSTRSEWWEKKIAQNKARDQRHEHQLKTKGWTIIVIWECTLRKQEKDETFRQLKEALS